MKRSWSLFVLLSMTAILIAYAKPVRAQAPNLPSPPSLAGKTVSIITGFGSGGGGLDLWARAVARHIGKHLPGKPAVVVQSMPGGGGLVAANHIYNSAPRDGTVMGIIVGQTAISPITGASGARYDPTRFTWVGKPTSETNVCVAYNAPRVKVKSVKDLYNNELVIGSTGPGAGSYSYPKALSAILGLKFKVIGGFPSATDAVLAIERGEVDGLCQSYAGLSGSRPDWIANHKVSIILRGGERDNPALADVPFVVDLGRTPDEKQAIEFLYAGDSINRSFVAPPDMSAERVTMLRDAFAATMVDSEFLDEAKKQNLDVAPQDGERLSAMVKRIYATPKTTVDRIVELIK